MIDLMIDGFITLRYDECLFAIRDLRDCLPYYEIFFAGEYPLSIRKGDIVLDLGAHIGFFTVYAAKRAKRVIAVEPLPRNFYNLRFNVMLNKLDNVILVNKAIAEKTGYGYFTKDFLSSHLSNHGIPCSTTTIDELLEELGLLPDVVKIDIEGAEVYCTNSRRLVEAREICIEAHGTQDLIERWLKSHKYICSRHYYNPIQIAKTVLSSSRANYQSLKLFLRCLSSLLINPISHPSHIGNIWIVYGKKYIK